MHRTMNDSELKWDFGITPLDPINQIDWISDSVSTGW